jgi:hypothetical protein
MTDNEKKLVIALVRMVHQYLDRYGDEADSRSMSGGEQAIEVLCRARRISRLVRRSSKSEGGRRNPPLRLK